VTCLRQLWRSLPLLAAVLLPVHSASEKIVHKPLTAGGSTIIYTAKGKPVGRIDTDVLRVVDRSGDDRERVDTVGNVVWLDDAACLAPPCGDGYARRRPGGFWYVNAIYPVVPQVRTIGTVRRRTSRTWDAYLGLGSHAHRVGYASGRYPAIGAEAFLVDFTRR
jgi:hypothetical protein